MPGTELFRSVGQPSAVARSHLAKLNYSTRKCCKIDIFRYYRQWNRKVYLGPYRSSTQAETVTRVLVLLKMMMISKKA